MQKMLLHFIAHIIPKIIAHERMNAFIADDGKLPVTEGNTNQHTIAGIRFVHTQFPERMRSFR